MNGCAGIVLTGGHSSRMGTPKATLDWHGATVLARVVGLLARALDGPVVVVRAPGQRLPPLPPSVEVAEDAREGRGPLEGLAAGLRALAGRVDRSYVSSTDVPLLHPAFIGCVVTALTEDVDAAVPRVEGRLHPLAAAYRTALLPAAEMLLAADRRRASLLFDRARTRYLDRRDLLADPALRAADPELLSLRNLNGPADYQRAHRLPLPEIRVERLGALAPSGGDGPAVVRADMLGVAAAAVGVELDARVAEVLLNGTPIEPDSALPLVAGDLVTLTGAGRGAARAAPVPGATRPR